MGWERGRYYTRSRRENGRVVREYIGGGHAGAIVSEMDAAERDRRETEAEDRRALRVYFHLLPDADDSLAGMTDKLFS